MLFPLSEKSQRKYKFLAKRQKLIMGKKIKIYLCDLVHNYSGVGSYMFPLNIGYIAAYAKKFFSEEIDIRLFKYPEDFIREFKKNTPDMVGFSNYTWNTDLNNKISAWVKSIFPETIVVFGGPNINYSLKGYRKFFSTHNSADFYILYQGESAFVNLLKEIFNNNLKTASLKSKAIDGVVFYDKNSDKIVKGENLPRIKDLNKIPSPYLTGILDEFFDTNLIPIMESNRGCPYQCTYCCQGLASYNQIEFYDLERVKEELKYIAGKIKNTNILNFADSNFGIVERDMEIAKYIAELMEKTDYPRKFNVNWAKNQPKLFELAKILKNINLDVALQSLDEQVLKNIKRQNIDLSLFRKIIDEINKEGGISGTEIILALPGETKQSHMETIRKIFDWNASYVVCYNCLVLDGSELSLARESGEFECKTKFRLIDNSFGKYNGIMSFEAEEGIRATSTLSEEEILYFRPVHWVAQFLWNYRFYYDLLKYLQSLNINPLDYIINLIDNVDGINTPDKVKKIFQEFKEEAKAEWFDSAEALQEHYSQAEHFDWLEKGNYGKMNSKYIFKVLAEAKEEFEAYLYDRAINYSPICSSKKEIFCDLINFLSADIIDFNKSWDEIAKEKTSLFKYDILSWRDSKYEKNLEEFYHPEGLKIISFLPKEQEDSLGILLKQYEHKNKNVTLRKMSEFMDIRDFFYKIKAVK